MANFLLIYARITFVLIFIDIAAVAVLSVHEKKKEEMIRISHGNHSGNMRLCFNKTDCNNKTAGYIDITTSTHDHNWLKYRTMKKTNDNHSYKPRSKTTAVLISVYFGVFGIDWFYLSRGSSRYIIVGICKLLVSFGCCSGWPILTLGTRRLSPVIMLMGYILSISFSLISLLWWIIDWARILADRFPDGNGIKLKHFSGYF